MSADESWQARSVRVDVKTTIGAGDSFVAGLTHSICQGASLPLAFRQGLAAGAAALLQAGTSLAHLADTLILFQKTECYLIK